MAENRARLLIGCYRQDNFADPEIAARAFVAVLMRYPEDVVIAVTEPATGIPAKLKWPPSIAEVVAACDADLAPMVRQLRRDQIAFEQRTGITSAIPPEARPMMDEINTKLKGLGLRGVVDGDLKGHARDDPSEKEKQEARDAEERAKSVKALERRWARLGHDTPYCSREPGFRLPVSPELVRLIQEKKQDASHE